MTTEWSCYASWMFRLAARLASLAPNERPRTNVKEPIVPRSVLDAIKMGLWDYEPPEVPCNEFDGSNSMPGTKGKLGDLAERVRCGLPLWHPDDRDELEELIQPREKAPAESEALRTMKPR